MFSAIYKRESELGALFATLVVLVLCTLMAHTPEVLSPQSGPAALLMEVTPSWIRILIYGSVVFLSHVLFQDLLRIQSLSNDKDNLFLFSWMLMAVGNPVLAMPTDAAMAGLFFLWSLRDLKSVYIQTNQSSAFNIGLKICLGYLFYKTTALLLPVLILAMLLGGALNLRLLFLMIFGFITPLYMIGGSLFLVDQLGPFLSVLKSFPEISVYRTIPDKKVWFPILTLLIITLSLYSAYRTSRRQDQQYGIFNQFFLLLGLLSLPAVFLIEDAGFRAFVFLAPTLAYFNGRVLKAIGKKWAFELLILLQLGLIFFLRFPLI